NSSKIRVPRQGNVLAVREHAVIATGHGAPVDIGPRRCCPAVGEDRDAGEGEKVVGRVLGAGVDAGCLEDATEHSVECHRAGRDVEVGGGPAIDVDAHVPGTTSVAGNVAVDLVAAVDVDPIAVDLIAIDAAQVGNGEPVVEAEPDDWLKELVAAG